VVFKKKAKFLIGNRVMSPNLQTQTIKIKPILGGHETFAFRNGWLKKGIDAAVINNAVFTEEDAPVILGVGKNMVRSIKHWCLAAGLLEESDDTGRSHPLQPTWLASNLFVDGGWDPYLEREGSLWLMHWQIASNRIRGLVWSIAFSEYLETEFSKLSLTNFVAKQLDRVGLKTTRDMIQRELDCFLHTYVTTRTSNKQKSKSGGISEDNLDCPLAELDLIRYMPEYDLYHFNIGPKNSLPVEIFGYSLLLFISEKISTRSTIALEECIYQPDSPGQIFKLDENSIVENLISLERCLSGGIHLVETAGISQVYLTEKIARNLETSARDLLQSYYE
jgi:hypothetical protein